MLSPDDAELARRDPALPGLAVVLDDERIAAAVGDAGDTALAGVWRRTYARYKPELSCVVAYEVATGDEVHDAYAKAYPPARYARRERQRGQAMALDDVAVVMRPASADPRIEFRALAGEAAMTLRYWPERRYTCQVGAGRAKVALKLYSPRAFATAAPAAAALRECASPRIPRLIKSSKRERSLTFEWLPGLRLDHAIADPGFDGAGLIRVGTALAQLHAHPRSALRACDPVARTAFARKRTEWISRVVDPELGASAKGIAERAATGLADPFEHVCATHGDFSPAQVLVDGEAVAIIDLDGAASGDPLADIGAFIAQLERRAVDGTITIRQAKELADMFIAGYEETAGAVNRDRAALWTATELVARAPGAFRRPGTSWRERVAALVTRAGVVLEDGIP